MRISDLIKEDAAGVGRIVKGVNTTVDVGPDEIRKQAKKFRLEVDKDGRPPIAKTNGSDALTEKTWSSKLDEAALDPALDGSNISVTGTEKAEIQRKNDIRPGTPEWFRLWFSLPYLTGEKPVG